MKSLISTLLLLLLLFPPLSWSENAYFSENILSIEEVSVPPGKIVNAKLKLAEDGRWDLLQYQYAEEQKQKEVRQIAFGFNSGFCFGYCNTHVLINPYKITLTKIPNRLNSADEQLPNIITEVTQSIDSWNSLVKLIDFSSFESLPDTIGCPGCADAPSYFIQIDYDNKNKRIVFEEQDVPGGELFIRLNQILLEQDANLQLGIEKLYRVQVGTL
ncbi:hypothetical protein [Nitrosomonas communis]|uniref:Uncharacterized protein n=1 Tax=Nitrosomonas communis TaxID=44574 RepID=A0A1I4U037_9PROT|nr:hypothetical protein [Nitrosomonas communis]SFM82245.1 hypothetical protein SAMN05421863_10579 [Nitrosomonas communis]